MLKRTSVFIIILLFSILCAFKPAIATTFQPTAPYYATFFYLWSQNPNTDAQWSYWSDNSHTPPQNWFSNYIPDPYPTLFDPQRELYSANNDGIIYWQLRKLAEAKQEIAIGSWWGQGHKSDIAFKHIITDVMNRTDNPYPNLRWALYYEKEGFGNPALSELVSDLNYIKASYTSQPGYFKINGKPVIFVYNAAHAGYDPLEDLSRWSQARQQTGFYIVMKADPLSKGGDRTLMDGWHEYAPANRSGTRATDFYFVSPGFWLEGTAQRLTRDLTAFNTAVSAMVQANVTWKLTETWNEWGEGSSVEPGEQVTQTKTGVATLTTNAPPFKNSYIDILNRLLPPLEQGTGAITTGSPTPTQSTTTITPTGDPVIAAVGDIVCGTADIGLGYPCKDKETAEVVAQIKPSAVLVLGDNQYESGSLSDFQNFYDKTWGKYKSITYPIPGNHEYGPGHIDATGYFNYFGTRAGPAGKGYYSYDIGSWHMIALNTNDHCKYLDCGAGSEQELWLKQDLASHRNVCTLAYLHHPQFSSGHEGSDPNHDFDALWKDLYDARVDVALVGHSHDYERFAPQTWDGKLDNVNGIREFVVGTGGRDFTGWLSTTAPNSEVKNNTTFGVLKLTLHPNSYDWKFMPIAGQTFTDSGTALCSQSISPSPTISIIVTTTNPPTPVGTSCSLKQKGDADCSGTIDLVDFEIWRKEFTGTLTTKKADYNSNSSIDLADFEIWRRSFFP